MRSNRRRERQNENVQEVGDRGLLLRDCDSETSLDLLPPHAGFHVGRPPSKPPHTAALFRSVQITFPWPNDNNKSISGRRGGGYTSLKHEEKKNTTLHEYDTYLLPGVLFSELAIYAFPPQKLQIRQTEEEEEEVEEGKEAPRGRRHNTAVVLCRLRCRPSSFIPLRLSDCLTACPSARLPFLHSFLPCPCCTVIGRSW